MKKNLTKVMAMGMVFTILAGTTAFADDALLISTNENAVETVIEEAQAAAYLCQSGKVVSVEAFAAKGEAVVEIANEQGGLRFAMASGTVIVNRVDGSYLTVAQLKEGMEIAVVYDRNSPMGASMPPYLGSVSAVVANADAGFFAVGHFDNDLIDMKNMLQLHITDNTAILNLQGAKIRLTAEAVKGQDALVFYDNATKSLPAQTEPSFVLLLTEAEVQTGETKMETATMIPLRETAEKLGYTVTWQGKNKPVLLKKEGVSMEIIIASDTYVVDGDMAMQAAMPSELKDSKLYVSSDIFELI